MNSTLKIVGEDVLEKLWKFLKAVGVIALFIIIVMAAVLIISGVVGTGAFFLIKAVAPHMGLEGLNFTATYAEQFTAAGDFGGAIAGLGIAVALILTLLFLVGYTIVTKIKRVPYEIRRYIENVKHRAILEEDRLREMREAWKR